MSVLVTWMNLVAVIQSAVSQKEKISIVYEHIYMEPRKMVMMNLFEGRNREQTCGHSRGREGGTRVREWH